MIDKRSSEVNVDSTFLILKAHRWPNFVHCCFGHVDVIRRCGMIFWEFYGKYGIIRAFCEAKERKIWTFILGVMVIRGSLFI
jgi:hypothetical protein